MEKTNVSLKKGAYVIVIVVLISLFYITLTQAVSVELNGNNSEIKTKNVSMLNGLQYASWNMWVKQDNYNARAGVLGKYESGQGNRSFLIRSVLNDSVSVVLSSDGGTGITHTSSTNRKCGIRENEEWTMITIVFNKTNIMYYRNGTLCDTDTTIVRRLFDTKIPVNIGGANQVFFGGEVDDFKIYKNALSSHQVKRLYEESEHGSNLGKSVPTLVYHQVVEVANATDKVTIINFEAQMKYLNQSGFIPVTVSQYNAWKKGEFAMPKKPILITFDDGWSSIYKEAYPIMKKYGLKGTEFIISDYANQVSGSAYSNWTELKELENEGWDMQAHGVQHVNMLTLNETEFRTQLVQSQANVTENLGTKPVSFVFPFHSANESYTQICGEYYELCWTHGNSASNPAYVYQSTSGNQYNALRRITIAFDTTISLFKKLLGRDTDIKAEWLMDEGNGTVIKDSSGNKYDASIKNGEWR
ncbi:MAG: polysaccharide deacetylase family protein [Candidatus Nanoarchaeia archaeon]